MAFSAFFATLLLPSTSPLSLPKTSSSRSRSRSSSAIAAHTASPPCLTASSTSACVSDDMISSSMSGMGMGMEIAYPGVVNSSMFYFKPGYFHVEVIPDDNEPQDSLINRFRKEVLKAGVLQECKRRRFFENKHDKKKRKARQASRRNRKRKPQSKAPPQKKHEAHKKKKDDDEDDNWELPDVDPPYC